MAETLKSELRHGRIRITLGGKEQRQVWEFRPSLGWVVAYWKLWLHRYAVETRRTPRHKWQLDPNVPSYDAADNRDYRGAGRKKEDVPVPPAVRDAALKLFMEHVVVEGASS